MKYHLQMLRKYLSVDATPEDIAQKLILKTCEIEDVHTRTLPETIVIGKITAIRKHPDADKLNICQVDCGKQGTFQIICGGTNVAEGLLVPTALVGTSFPDAGITIAKRTMRGVDSEGMICSKGELGINEDTETHRIWDLSQDTEVHDEDIGHPLREKFPWLETTLLEVDSKSLTNRPDLTGHFGLAVELNAIYPEHQKKFNGIKTRMNTFRDTDILEILRNTEKPLNREIKVTSEAVNTYTLLGLQGVTIKKSDFFSRLQLLDLGNNPINNWVDFSNLFMNISGLPIHCFDADKVKGAIILRDAIDGETFTDLQGAEHILKSTDIVVADEEKILALAGIIGGQSSAISETTKNILIELANFDPVIVRKTGTRLGLRTDAELRFEKNIAPAFSMYAVLLLLEELKFYVTDLGEYEIEGIASYIKSGLNPLIRKTIPCPWKELENLIFGEEQNEFQSKASHLLKNLGFIVQNDSVQVPLWRGPDDLNIKEDIAEEIARILGYETITSQPLLSEVKAQPFSESVAILREIEEIMINQFKFDQVETYPWIGEQQIKTIGSEVSHFYHLQNPLNPEFPFLRDSMIYNLLPLVAKNSKFFDTCKVFDIGKVWTKLKIPTNVALDERYATHHFCEEMQLGAFRYEKSVSNRKEDPLLKMKSMILSLMKHLGIQGKIMFEKSDSPAFHPKKQAKLLLRNGTNPLDIGSIATFHPLVMQQQKFPEGAQLCYFTLNLELIKSLTHQQQNSKEYETLQDQIVWRDLSFVIDAKESFEKVVLTLEKMKEISSIKVFDLYEGKNLGEGKKSIAVQIKIKGDGNMTTDAINAIMQSAIKKVEAMGASLRA